MADVLTLTDLYGDIYKRMDIVRRELVGFIPSVTLDANQERVAKDQLIKTFVTSEATLSDFAAGQLAPTAADRAPENRTMAITKERIHNIVFDGNNQKRLNGSYGWRSLLIDEIEQGLRKLTNEMEADLAATHAKASRAASPDGTNLFDAANYNDIANARKILADNGAPLGDVSLVLNTTAGAAFRGNPQYYGADTAGSDSFLRQGNLMNIHNVNVRESGQIATLTAGTGTGYLVNNASAAIGDTTIPVDTGSGTIVAGDVITIAGDTNQYVVATALASGNVVIAEPGLMVAVANNAAVTVKADTTHNVMIARSAIHLATRLLPIPEGNDSSTQNMVITDPVSGMNFDLREYKEFGQVRWILGASWGVEMIKPEFSALLID